MPSATLKRNRPYDHNGRVKRVKKVKKQAPYHSSSEDEPEEEEEEQISEPSLEAQEASKTRSEELQQPEDEDEEGDEAENDEDNTEKEDDLEDDSASDHDTEMPDAPTKPTRRLKKSHDPDAFATSISKILGSKLSTSKRADPLLSRSMHVTANTAELQDAKLEAKARHQMREEKRKALDRGRVKDVLGTESADVETAAIIEQERRLRRTAQKGVIKLFNAVRAAQVKGEQAEKEAREKGVVGIQKREEKVTEMSKQGFLDLIAGGGKAIAAKAST